MIALQWRDISNNILATLEDVKCTYIEKAEKGSFSKLKKKKQNLPWADSGGLFLWTNRPLVNMFQLKNLCYNFCPTVLIRLLDYIATLHIPQVELCFIIINL
jgi:hypothetical protein